MIENRPTPTGLRPGLIHGENQCLNRFPPVTSISCSPQKSAGPFSETAKRAMICTHIWAASPRHNCPPIIVGGMEDHVHILALFGRTLAQADWVKELKRVSNLWLKEQGPYGDFQWQGGYAGFSVSESELERVKSYIAIEEAHHRKLNYQDELRAPLRKHDVEWDERYVWD